MKENYFGIHAEKYDRWYEKHHAVYESELQAIRELLPDIIPGRSLEIGVGTARFASTFEINYGIDPSQKMLEIAVKRAIRSIRGIAEELPLKSSSMKLVLMVTSLCFTDRERTLREIHRVLAPRGELIIAFIELNSPLGQEYTKRAAKSSFFKNATFFSAMELVNSLKDHGFDEFAFRQTLFKPMSEIKVAEKPIEGFGSGSFVVIKATNIKDW